MAASAAAALLDELMGRNRNLAPDDTNREIRWDDKDVCKYYMCGFCPNELFTNTRADLGSCDKIHDDKLLEGYRKSTRFERQGYEEDMMRYLQSLLSDVERRIKRGHARLALNNQQGGMGGAADATREERSAMLTQRITELLEEAEQLGCEGKVEEAQGIMKLCEQLKEERTELEKPPQLLGRRGQILEEDMSKRMEVCEVCGALLVAGDAQQRIDEHIMGKQHMGYARIRAYVEERRKKRQAPIEEREARLAKEREERDAAKEKEREDRKAKEAEREKEREKEREERRVTREKERKERDDKDLKEKEDKDKKRRRSRSRDHKRSRSRSRDRRRRSRSKDRRRRSRSRDRDRHHRSRSHRSRSRDRSRRSSRDRKSRDEDKDRSSKDKDRSHRDKSKDKDRTSREKSKDKDGEKAKDGEPKDAAEKSEEDKPKEGETTEEKQSENHEAKPEGETKMETEESAPTKEGEAVAELAAGGDMQGESKHNGVDVAETGADVTQDEQAQVQTEGDTQ